MTRDAGIGNNPIARWIGNDSFRARPPDLAVYRRRVVVVYILVLGGVAGIVVFSGLLTLSATDVAGHIILPLLCWLFAIIGWMVGVAAVVRVRADSLVVDNVLVRHVVPWERFAGLFVEGSQGMFARLDDGRVVKSMAFGRSLSDASEGYSHMRVTLERVREDCRQAKAGHVVVDPPPAYQRRLNMPWRPLLAFLVFFEAASWLAFAAHGG